MMMCPVADLCVVMCPAADLCVIMCPAANLCDDDVPCSGPVFDDVPCGRPVCGDAFRCPNASTFTGFSKLQGNDGRPINRKRKAASDVGCAGQWSVYGDGLD